MSQPIWKLLANLGDKNPLDYGGFFVYVDETGVYPPEVEVVEVCDEPDYDNNDKGKWTVYRFILEPCTYIDGILSDNPFHMAHPAWFATPESERTEGRNSTTWLKNLVDFCGNDDDGEELIRLFCSDDPLERARAWRVVGDYHGYHELDHYPLRYSSKLELKKRYLDMPRELWSRFDMFWRGYTESLCFTATLEDTELRGMPLFREITDFSKLFGQVLPFLSDGEMDELLADASGFFVQAQEHITFPASGKQPEYDSRAGYDFHLSRNGHGAGFFDSFLWGEHRGTLQSMAKVYSTLEMTGTRGDDGNIDSANLYH